MKPMKAKVRYWDTCQGEHMSSRSVTKAIHHDCMACTTARSSNPVHAWTHCSLREPPEL